jgi:mono/diheme cytochrome c family protein
MRGLALLLLLPLSTALAEDNTANIEAGKKIFEARCTDACHQTPRADHLNARQWRVVLNTMQTRMQSVGMTPLTAQELEQVYQYISRE